MISILPSRKHDGGHLSKETADEVLISSYTPDFGPLAPLDLWPLGLSHTWLQPDIWPLSLTCILGFALSVPTGPQHPQCCCLCPCQPPNYLRPHWDSTSGWPCPLSFFPEQPFYGPVPASHLPQGSLQRRTIQLHSEAGARPGWWLRWALWQIYKQSIPAFSYHHLAHHQGLFLENPHWVNWRFQLSSQDYCMAIIYKKRNKPKKKKNQHAKAAFKSHLSTCPGRQAVPTEGTSIPKSPLKITKKERERELSSAIADRISLLRSSLCSLWNHVWQTQYGWGWEVRQIETEESRNAREKSPAFKRNYWTRWVSRQVVMRHALPVCTVCSTSDAFLFYLF